MFKLIFLGVLAFSQPKEGDFTFLDIRLERGYFKYVEDGRYLYGVYWVKPTSPHLHTDTINRFRRLN